MPVKELEELREGMAQLPSMGEGDTDTCNYQRCKEYKYDCRHCRAGYILSYLAEQGMMLQTPHGLMMLSDLLKEEAEIGK